MNYIYTVHNFLGLDRASPKGLFLSHQYQPSATTGSSTSQRPIYTAWSESFALAGREVGRWSSGAMQHLIQNPMLGLHLHWLNTSADVSSFIGGLLLPRQRKQMFPSPRLLLSGHWISLESLFLWALKTGLSVYCLVTLTYFPSSNKENRNPKMHFW